ncbi:deoxyribodipyrimidine photolyase [Aquabacterium olei]|uniref:Deoxyribodipyrimidine photolyase n=1 Tax=Aquabacterium olei TaxID=1296669 RepID=A0A2U8FS05_9BURK|nr:FAD-binding domain-containing protein [Aquabacterium olei]AWI53056.1 deoxyribodipyrimidine photolyase [Aquabacterium olei]
MSALVWFKRDLRTVDHAPLHAALARHGAAGVRCLYVIEPSLWRQPDASARQWAFVRESLIELEQALSRAGCRLMVRQGEVVDVLDALWLEAPFEALLAHEETGNAVTYQRDVAVAQWCTAHGVVFGETPQTGVVRRLRDRNGWHRHWQRFMASPTLRAPMTQDVGRAAAPGLVLPASAALGLTDGLPRHRQRGGREAGMAVLNEFLHDRCGRYRGGISSPLSAPTACSRLSPYLAWGCLSMREVVQATEARMDVLHAQAALDPHAARQHAGLSAFLSRLHWHCHFIQKLESEPELEWRNLHRGYDGLRDETADEARLAALMAGRTGWPLVDACVTMLRETGWLNFRMRAMLVSVATYPLWLHWRPVGLWLARQFVDYEPGIHWSQMQMQAGTTGINTTRVYNPIKQARDQDPQGHFVRRWLPALRRVPDTWLFEPWRMPPDVQQRCGVRVGSDPAADIPLPLVDLETALRTARAQVHAVRARPDVKAAVAGIVERHGSRVNRDGRGLGPRRSRSPATPAADHPQLSLEF